MISRQGQKDEGTTMDEVTAIGTIAVLISLALSLWVYRDSKKRGNAPLNWAVGFFIVVFMGAP
jgi:hypothetical protein